MITLLNTVLYKALLHYILARLAALRNRRDETLMESLVEKMYKVLMFE